MKSLQGHFLVASPYLGDGNFFRTVILMIRHDSDSALGVVINRPSNKTISEVWKAINEPDSPRQDLIYIGGPVPGPLMAVHGVQTLQDTEVVEGVYFTAEKEKVLALVHDEGTAIRLFSGYSGWGSGQLERELAEGSWLVCEADREAVFADADSLWKAVASRIGLSIMGVNSDDAPADPELN
jgi:putative transcriptional regulator